MKRMTIPEIRMHPWFQAHLPRYLAVPPPDSMQRVKKTDEDILTEVIKMGFDRDGLAIKMLKAEHITTVMYQEFAQEVYIMRKIRHPNVVQFIGACTKSSSLCIVTGF